jgi:hypothetical protein
MKIFGHHKEALLAAFLFLLCGCSLHSPGAEPTAVPATNTRFTEESIRALACLDGLSALVSSSEPIYMPQQAKCREHLSYLNQTKATEQERLLAKRLRSLSDQIYLCHILAASIYVPGNANKLGKCGEEESKLRGELPGAENATAKDAESQ